MNNSNRKNSNTIDYLDAWDWGINIDDENIESSNTKYLIELCNGLVKAVKAFYYNDQSFSKMDMISKYKTAIKTVWFAFERNKTEFEKSLEKRYSRELSNKEMQDESRTICSWVCIEVIFALLPKRNTNKSDIF